MGWIDQFNQYSQKVIDHFINPRNVGEIEDADGIGVARNPACGDLMKLFIKIKDGRIEDAKFKTYGCSAAIAASSMLTELIKGKSLPELKKITKEVVTEALDGLPKGKLHCSALAEDTLKAALKDFYRRQEEEGKGKLRI